MLETFHSADSLPPDWDARCGDHYFLKTSFLQMLERVHPCGQRYYAFRDSQGRLDSVMQTYQHPRFNLGTHARVPFYRPVTMVYPPLSIARPSLLLGEATRPEVEQALHSIPGVTLLLNLPPESTLSGFGRGPNYPQIVLGIRWARFSEYLESLRSPYRRRAKLAFQRAASLEVSFLPDNAQFDAELYDLYEQVYNQSRTKIEKVPIGYFQAPFSRVLVARAKGRPVGFLQLFENGPELVFVFVGMDYCHNHTFDTYHFLMLKMVEYAIDKRFEHIDLGQTAEDTKLRLGGERRPLLAMIGHSNPLLHKVFTLTSPLLAHRPRRMRFHVFKDAPGGNAPP